MKTKKAKIVATFAMMLALSGTAVFASTSYSNYNTTVGRLKRNKNTNIHFAI